MKKTKKSRVGRYERDVSLAKVRSALTNGSDLLGGDVDHRSAWVRRLRDLIQGHIADAGGIDLLSTAEQSIVRRASMLELQMEMLETAFAANDGMATSHQLLLYQWTANSTRRLLESVGLKRHARDVTPSLNEYMASKRRQPDDADYEEAEEAVT
jgi:hypothetical protein